MKSTFRRMAAAALVFLLTVAVTALAQRPAPTGSRIPPPTGSRIPGGSGFRRVDPVVPLRSNVEASIKSAPHEALKTLGQEGHLLGKPEQVTLARQAVDQLATRAQTTKELGRLVLEVRQAREAAKLIDRDVYLNLRGMERQLERQAFVSVLERVHDLANRGEWQQAGKLAQEPQPIQGRKTSAEVQKALSSVVQVSKQAEAVGHLESVLKTPEQVRLEHMPAEL
jgi:hypothetical protein